MNAKSRPIPDIPCSEGQVRQGEDEATMRKFKSMIQLYDIVELASQSTEKHNHFTLALEKVHKELLVMEDHVECSQKGERTNDDQILRSQVVSNFSQMVQDPSRVLTKGRPKSLRAKNPKESQPTKKRRCTICKNEGHTRNNCPSVRLQFTIRPDTASPSRSHAQSPISRRRSAISVDHPSLPIVVKFTKPKSPLARQQLTQSRPHQYTTPADPRLVDDQPFRPVVADQPSSAIASIFSISHRKMNDDDVLPTNIVDSSSSKGDEAVGSGSLEVAPLKGNVKPLALGGKG
ncbi:hypothetical protein LWI29_018492 [Acer saccharum]|uniref:CCHC-type domain-containing protein n=1 Tax=Acer saccharum TaxID=4024 RepID=A0AA39W9Q2_ACESA|nr:hypothetical protein LWI29_018492 [Acer saccharum]